jgi:DNA repair photolyase
MIVSASYKTDIPAFYGSWFRNRLAAGYARVANPYGGKPFTVDLTPEGAEAFVFWTRNAEPFLDTLEALATRRRPFMVQVTVTGYPRSLERSVIDPERAVAQLREMARHFGPRSVVWRYDPVLITDVTPPEFHEESLRRLAAALSGSVDEVVLSFATIYRKTGANLGRLARESSIAWRDPEPEEKRALLARLAEIAADHGIRPTLCAQPELLSPGLEPAACIDRARLSDIAGGAIAGREKGNRPGCLCAESRDIGAYDSCPHGCLYCYAVGRPETAKRKLRAHDPEGAFLFPPGGGATR